MSLLVRVAFFGGLTTLKRVEDPLRALGSRVRVASLSDLAGMKMRVIQMRASWQDCTDIFALVEHGIDVSTGLAARAIDTRFEPEVSIRALQFFGGRYALAGAGNNPARLGSVGARG